MGIVLTAGALSAYFASLRAILPSSATRSAGPKAQQIVLLLAQAAGLVGCVAMVLSAAFPINHAAAHSFWPAAIYIGLGTGLGLTLAALRYHPRVHRWALAYGGLAVLTDLVISVAFHEVAWLEWLDVALLFSTCVLFGVEAAGAANHLSSDAPGQKASLSVAGHH